MNVWEMKLKIFREIDSLEDSKLVKLYGVMLNLKNGNDNYDSGKTISHKEGDEQV
ncbi:MAG: hypothetical protein M3R36_04375 [Bacteroidota bacterium]|nr:hypothetical protein [Bacteroidota bacterium]